MRIQESDIRLTSQHTAEREYKVSSQGSYSFKTLFQSLAAGESGATGATGATQGTTDPEEKEKRLADLISQLVDAILAALDKQGCQGKMSKVKEDLADLQADLKCAAGEEMPTVRPQRAMDWTWTASESLHEHEESSVQGSGQVLTADGKRIDFQLNLDLCRDYSCQRDVKDGGTIVLHDPLVLNYGGKSVELSDERVDFDLDTDGWTDRIPGLMSGSGYLALDRNGNGKIDNGSELFGTASGDGFADLAKLDADGNGWLDEADPEFARLKLWNGRPDGEVAGLGSQQVGAIWLGHTDNTFSLKNADNDLLGQIRAAGVYLREDGQVGTVQQVDLVIEPTRGGPETTEDAVPERQAA